MIDEVRKWPDNGDFSREEAFEEVRSEAARMEQLSFGLNNGPA